MKLLSVIGKRKEGKFREHLSMFIVDKVLNMNHHHPESIYDSLRVILFDVT